ncbi:MAG: AI-2E family transporter [Oscillospiraceae bacterium]|nr:AI-2E family transporter [Oscillospiraceae bacterium]MBQ7816256.1 AI-2E family transporter [Oscillospiraceae bacterium]
MQNNVKNYFTKSTISNIITVCTAVLLYLAISHFTQVRSILATLYGVISPFVVAFVMAFLLHTPVAWFERTVFSKFKVKRALSILCSYLIAALAISALIVAAAPQVADSVVSVGNNIPKYIQTVTGFLDKLTTEYNWDPAVIEYVTEAMNSAMKNLSAFVLALVPQIINWSVSLGNVAIDFFMSLIASIYMLATKERLIFQMKKILFSFLKEKRANRILEIGSLTNEMFSKFINGKALDSLIIGILCFIGMMFIYSPYAILIAIIVGVTNMIPFFGPFIGAIPSALILLMVSPIDAVIFGVFVLALQQFDGNILGPKILGDSTGLAPIWVLVSITIGGGLMGFVGMIIGVPTFAVFYSLLSENMDKRLAKKNITADRDKLTLSFEGDEK